MKFTKMNGTGNDFIIVNNINEAIGQEQFPALAKKLCHRRFGIGADGFMVVEEASAGGDYKMVFYNSDGSMGEMCGNGARCIARYGYDKGLAGEVQHIETTAGMVTGWRQTESRYRVQLNPVTVMKRDMCLFAEGREWNCAYVELGNPGIPHAVVCIPGLAHSWLDDTEKRRNLFALGSAIRYHEAFPKGANVNFFDITGEDQLVELTYERGVEDFTFACGTGTGSVVSVLYEEGLVSGRNVRVSVPGGILRIDIEEEEESKNLYLTGPTCVAAEGEVGEEILTTNEEEAGQRSNIILIGMAGAGKSTTGVVVAKIMQKDFIDGDLVIQTVTGRGLQDIIDSEGNDAFRKIENQVLCGIDAENAVIAPGGSAIYYPQAMAHLREKGVVVYLHVPLQEIQRRLTNLATRGVTLAEGQTIADLYNERMPLYEKYADIRIDTEGNTLEETVAKIVEAVREYKHGNEERTGFTGQNEITQ